MKKHVYAAAFAVGSASDNWLEAIRTSVSRKVDHRLAYYGIVMVMLLPITMPLQLVAWFAWKISEYTDPNRGRIFLGLGDYRVPDHLLKRWEAQKKSN